MDKGMLVACNEARWIPMGWSESYQRDMREEAIAQLCEKAEPLLSALKEFQAAMAKYQDFLEDRSDLEELINDLVERLDASRPST